MERIKIINKIIENIIKNPNKIKYQKINKIKLMKNTNINEIDLELLYLIGFKDINNNCLLFNVNYLNILSYFQTILNPFIHHQNEL